jgi:hypothetical protein
MRLRIPTRKGCAAAAAIAAGVLGLATPMAGASASTLPTGSGAPSLQPAAFTFVPPKVGPISVDIAPIIINGQVVNPALHVLMPGVSALPISSTPPA